MVPVAIRPSSVDMRENLDVFSIFPRPSLPVGASLPSPGSSGASSPASSVLSKRCDFLPPLPPHFVAFARQYLNVHSFFSLLGGRVRRQGLELVTRCSSQEFAEETTGSPKFLGNPHDLFTRVPATPAGLPSPDHYGAAAWPPLLTTEAPTMGLSALKSTAFRLAV